MKIGKKGVAELSQNILAFVVVGVVATVGFLVWGGVQKVVISIDAVDTTNYSTGHWTSAFNSTITSGSAINTIISFLPIIAIVMIGGYIILYLLKSFGSGGQQGGQA